MQAGGAEEEVLDCHRMQSTQPPLAFLTLMFSVSQFLAECRSQEQAVTFPK